VDFYNTIIYEVLSTHFFLCVQEALAPDASIHTVKQALKRWNQIAFEKPDEESWMAYPQAFYRGYRSRKMIWFVSLPYHPRQYYRIPGTWTPLIRFLKPAGKPDLLAGGEN
jgi:hypothetical protein